MAVICARIGARTGESGLARARLAASSRRTCSSSRPVSAVTSWSRIGGLLGAVVLLGAYRGEFPLDVGTDGRIGPQGFEASCELVAIEIQLAGGELADRPAVLVMHRRPAWRGRPARRSLHQAWPAGCPVPARRGPGYPRTRWRAQCRGGSRE